MFGMEAAQEQIQSSLGNVKKPDFPEQSFYAEALNAEHCVEQKNEGMAPSNGPTEDNQKNLEKAETPTERKLDQIKAEADKMGEEHSNFNAFEEVENSLFTVGEHIRKNSRIYTSAGTTLAGGALGAAVAHRQAKKAGKTGSEYRKLIAKKAALGAATGLAVGEAAHWGGAAAGSYKALRKTGLNRKESIRGAGELMNTFKGNILKSKRFGLYV
jgi:hypothetical protein